MIPVRSVVSRVVILRHRERKWGAIRPRHLPVPPARRGFSSAAALAASAIVKGERDEHVAAEAIIEQISQKFDTSEPACTLWFARGYGARSKAIGPLLQEKLGSGVVIGCNSESGVIGDGCEVQRETFALSALSLRLPGVQVFPFHSPDLGILPELRRGGHWGTLSEAASPPVVLTFCTAPSPPGADPEGWLSLFDQALTGRIGQRAGRIDSKTRRMSAVVGGIIVGDHVYVDGEVYHGGGFGVVFQAEGLGRGTHLDVLVCQGATPYGPWLKITGIEGDYIITGLNDQNPRELLEPLIDGPEVSSAGHSMAGIFVDPKPADKVSDTVSAAALAEAAMGGRPNCLLRPIRNFTPEGSLVLAPVSKSVNYEIGMQLQLHRYSQESAIDDLQARAEHDVELRGSPPDASLLIMSDARGKQLYSSEGVEIGLLRKVWRRDVPTAGFVASGEIGPVGLKTYMHNYTTCCLMLRGKSETA